MLCPTGVGLPLLVPSHWARIVGALCLACAVVVFVVGYIHHHALARRPPQASDTYETFKYDGVLWSEVRIPHTTNTSSRPERLRHSQRKYFRISSDALSLPSQVVLAHVGVVEQLAPAALEAVAAELQDEAAVGHGQRLLRVLLDAHRREVAAPLRDVADAPPENLQR